MRGPTWEEWLLLLDAIHACWSAETSASPDEWTPENPSRGQCAVVALVIQDEVGGDLLRSTVGGESHYWNRVDGGEVDYTLEQFPDGSSYDEPPVVRSRDYVLSHPDTARRYQHLRAAVDEYLSGAPQ